MLIITMMDETAMLSKSTLFREEMNIDIHCYLLLLYIKISATALNWGWYQRGS